MRKNMPMVECRSFPIEGLVELRPAKFGDARGFFSEVWKDEWASALGVDTSFVQDNHSYSSRRGVLRGMHFQSHPAAQDKLVRVTRGSVFDVALDLRPGSPTFRHWAGVTLSAQEWNQFFIPKGFAHGFVTLEDETEVLYKVSAAYSPEHDHAIRFDDPAIGIDWPVAPDQLIVSDRDRAAPLLDEIDTGF